MWNFPLPFENRNMPDGFEVTSDLRYLNTATAVVFHIPDLYKFKNHLPTIKPNGQIWIGWSLECEENYPILKSTDFRNLFDLWMGYRSADDILYAYFMDFDRKARTYADISQAGQNKPNGICMLISSAVNKSGRLEYLSELMRWLPIDSYGKVFHNKTLHTDSGRESAIRTMSDYKFTIAFENAVAPDYVTEKFYNPLYAGSVPIYLGAPNINEFSPSPDCFINVRDFTTPRALAEFLLPYVTGEADYRTFHEWRNRPMSSHFQRLLDRSGIGICQQLCSAIEQQLNNRHITNNISL